MSSIAYYRGVVHLLIIFSCVLVCEGGLLDLFLNYGQHNNEGDEGDQAIIEFPALDEMTPAERAANRQRARKVATIIEKSAHMLANDVLQMWSIARNDKEDDEDDFPEDEDVGETKAEGQVEEERGGEEEGKEEDEQEEAIKGEERYRGIEKVDKNEGGKGEEGNEEGGKYEEGVEKEGEENGDKESKEGGIGEEEKGDGGKAEGGEDVEDKSNERGETDLSKGPKAETIELLKDNVLEEVETKTIKEARGESIKKAEQQLTEKLETFTSKEEKGKKTEVESDFAINEAGAETTDDLGTILSKGEKTAKNEFEDDAQKRARNDFTYEAKQLSVKDEEESLSGDKSNTETRDKLSKKVEPTASEEEGGETTEEFRSIDVTGEKIYAELNNSSPEKKENENTKELRSEPIGGVGDETTAELETRSSKEGEIMMTTVFSNKLTEGTKTLNNDETGVMSMTREGKKENQKSRDESTDIKVKEPNNVVGPNEDLGAKPTNEDATTLRSGTELSAGEKGQPTEDEEYLKSIEEDARPKKDSEDQSNKIYSTKETGDILTKKEEKSIEGSTTELPKVSEGEETENMDVVLTNKEAKPLSNVTGAILREKIEVEKTEGFKDKNTWAEMKKFIHERPFRVIHHKKDKLKKRKTRVHKKKRHSHKKHKRGKYINSKHMHGQII